MPDIETNAAPASLDASDRGEESGVPPISSGKTNGVTHGGGGGFQPTSELENNEADSKALPATILGRYQVLEVVGRGAFSVVYRANQVGVGRIVALKVFRLHKSARRDPKSAESALLRFQREARLASNLRHPNTITLYDYDKTDSGLVYMGFEFVDGPTLSEEIKNHPQGIPVHRVIHIARQVASSLEEAHEKAIIHRDMKPGNIMITRDRKDPDFTKVLDFGIAKIVEGSEEGPDYNPDHTDVLRVVDVAGLHSDEVDITLDGKIVGTPRYVPPEQIRGGPLMPGSDIYSLGLIMHEMLSGVPANPGKSPREMVEWHLEDHPFRASPSYAPPAGLASIIRKATRRNPVDRYGDCTELIADLNRLDEDGEWIKEPTRRPVLLWLLAINALILLIGLIFLALWMSGDKTPAEVPVPGTEGPSSGEELPGDAKGGDPGGVAAAEPDAGEEAPSEVEVKGADAGEVVEQPLSRVEGPLKLSVSSDPDGARVFVGRKRIGVTPFSYQIGDKEEKVVFRFRRFGFDDVDVTWQRDRANAQIFPVPMARKNAGSRPDGGGATPKVDPSEGKGDDNGGKNGGQKDNKYFILK